ncbi:helix-turn-helix domain-containing protein, partial [Enterobacter hormaechei subsp. hoffmannii]|uniref:recombinase family protein n=2 Tax=Enterobacter hormaechei TaxID=158836 RepID=UPI002238CEFA
EWVHVQLHQQKGMISLSPPTICNSAGEIYTHLMAIFSSFERNRNIERTRSGLAAARARGRVGGRKPSLSEEDVKQIRILLADPEMTVGAVAKRFNVSRMTIYRYTTKS